MAKIGLIQVDGKIPNLALMKLAKHYEDLGNEIFFIDLSTIKADFWFGSKIFMGGSGYDIKANLPEDIEEITPDYEKFGLDYSIGFTSRGCIRNCEFCIVKEKEGIMRDVDMNWIKQKKVLLLDNNFLASPNWKEKMQYFIDNDLKVNFNQGLDIRLIDDEKAEMLSRVKSYDRTFSRRVVYFAFDDIAMKDVFIKKIRTLIKYIKPYKIMVYFIVGFNSSFKEDMERFKIMRKFGVDPFAMPYKDIKKNKKMLDFCRWVNKRYYKSCEFKDYKGRK